MGRRSGPICSSCLILPDAYHCRRCGSHIPAGQRVRTCSSSASLTDVWSQIQRDHRHVCREREGEAKIKRNNSEVRGSIKGEVGTSATVPLPPHPPGLWLPGRMEKRHVASQPAIIQLLFTSAVRERPDSPVSTFSTQQLHSSAVQDSQNRNAGKARRCRRAHGPHAHPITGRAAETSLPSLISTSVRLSACPPAVFAPPVAEILFLKICVFTRRPKSMTQPPGRRIRPHS